VKYSRSRGTAGLGETQVKRIASEMWVRAAKAVAPEISPKFMIRAIQISAPTF